MAARTLSGAPPQPIIQYGAHGLGLAFSRPGSAVRSSATATGHWQRLVDAQVGQL